MTATVPGMLSSTHINDLLNELSVPNELLAESIAPPPAPAPARPEQLMMGGVYFRRGLEDTSVLTYQAERALRGVDYDTIVCTGLSGISAGSILAHALGKNLFMVRKEDDQSTHDSDPAVGWLGNKWIFVDDFIQTGTTYRRVRDLVSNLAYANAVPTELTGALLYTEGRFADRKELSNYDRAY